MDKEYFSKKLEGLVNEYNTLVETGERLRNDLKNIDNQTLQKLGAIQEVQKIINDINESENKSNTDKSVNTKSISTK